MLSCEFCETLKNTIFIDHPETPASAFIERIYNITKLSVNQPKWLFQLFEALINIEMYTCKIKIA